MCSRAGCIHNQYSAKFRGIQLPKKVLRILQTGRSPLGFPSFLTKPDYDRGSLLTHEGEGAVCDNNSLPSAYALPH